VGRAVGKKRISGSHSSSTVTVKLWLKRIGGRCRTRSHIMVIRNLGASRLIELASPSAKREKIVTGVPAGGNACF